MKKTLFSLALAAVMSLGMAGCSDDKGDGTGAKTAEEAYEVICEDYIVGCELASGAVMTEDLCKTAMGSFSEIGGSEQCSLAYANYMYCVLKNYRGDACNIFESEDGMSDWMDNEAEAIGAACEDFVMEIMNSCNFNDGYDF